MMNRKALIIGVVITLAVVLAIVLAVALTVTKDDDEDDDDDDKVGNNENDTVPGTGILVRGQWTYWDPWSQCSTTCGGGSQVRQRSCADPAPENGGADCVGLAEESRACAEWVCPDCSTECPDDGDLIDCSLCQCNGTSTSGKVLMSGTKLPLADVEVYVIGHEWEPLTMTNRMGVFTLEDLCLTDLELKFVKPGYQTGEEKYSVQAGVVLSVEMEEQKKPAFKVHPQSISLFAGDPIFLTCNATGVPEPTTYEWFKNGDILEGDEDDQTNVLQINNAQTTHQGEYRCRAISAAGKKFSRAAKVIVKESGDDTCAREPTEEYITLPATCVLPSTGETTMDVGTCGSDRCVTRDADQAVGQRCCGPVTTEVIELECDGFEYSVSRVKTCGCSECQESDEITIEGIFVVVDEGVEKPVNKIWDPKIMIEGSVLAGRQSGDFTWTGTPSDEAVTVVFLPTSWFMGTVVIVHLIPGVSVYTVPITITRIEEPVVVNATDGFTLETPSSSPDTTPAAKLVVPPNALVDENGVQVTGDVDVFFTFYDPRDAASLAAAPGEFSFEDDEGEVRQLETFGVFGLRMTPSTKPYQTVFTSGKVGFDIDAGSLKIPENSDGQPDALLWTLDPVTGNWKESGPVEKKNLARKRRQTQTIVSGSSDFPPNLPFVNIDKILRERRCFVSVFVYSNENMTEGFPGQRVKIYLKDSTNTVYRGLNVDVTDKHGKACLAVRCGFPHEIVPFHAFGPTASTSHQLPVGFPFDNTHGGSRVAFTAPDISNIISGDGPVHKDSLKTCLGSTVNDYHFQFYLQRGPKPGRLDAVELRPNKTLSWYNAGREQKDACMMAIHVMTDTPSSIQLTAQSYHNNEAGSLYGSYITGIQRLDPPDGPWVDAGHYVGCVQIKCPGRVFDDDTQTTTEDVHTFVKFNLASRDKSQCMLDYTNVLNHWRLLSGSDGSNTVNAINFAEATNSSLKVDVQDIYYDIQHRAIHGPRYKHIRHNGFYQATGPNAANEVKTMCLNQRNGYAAAFDCADAKYSRYLDTGVFRRRRL